MMRPMSLAVTLVTGCSPVDLTFDEPDLDFNRMIEQPRYDAYERSAFFADDAVMQPPPEGTVPFVPQGDEARREPYEIDEELLAEGRDSFDRFCATCHGIAATGNTWVADRMALRPAPSLHTERARSYTNAQLRDIARDGYGLMPGYDYVLDRRARSAVVAYLRVLQLSQHAEVAELPADARQRLEEEGS